MSTVKIGYSAASSSGIGDAQNAFLEGAYGDFAGGYISSTSSLSMKLSGLTANTECYLYILYSGRGECSLR